MAGPPCDARQVMNKAMKEPEATPRRNGRTTRAGLLLPQAAAKAYRKHGFAESRLLTDWASVVGERLAEVCLPEKLARDGALSVRVSPAFALELQHLEPKILERIAGYFGHRAVSRLKLRQGIVEPPAPDLHRQPRDLTPEEGNALDERLAGVEDAALRAALERLGRAVIGSKPLPPGATGGA
jgi:hypothetical protein